jgi:hypothetical protein
MNFTVPDVIFIALILAYGVVATVYKIRFIRNSQIIQGIVKEVIYEGTCYCPIIEYVDKENPAIRHTYEFKNANKDFYHEIGKSVEILYYNDGLKTEIQINSWFEYWGHTIILIVIGIILTIII